MKLMMKTILGVLMMAMSGDAFACNEPLRCVRPQRQQQSMYLFRRQQAQKAASLVMVTNDVKTVSQTVRAFEALYTRPIVTVWRGPISDMLQVTHLSTVDKRFKYDPIFAYGYMYIFETLLDKYPVAGEKDAMIDATIRALDMDPATVRSDEKEVLEWLEGKTEAEILAAPTEPDKSRINKAFADIKSSDEYLHTRAANVGVITMIDKVGLKPDNATLTRWTEALGMRKRNVEKDAILLKDVRDKMVVALQMVKSLEIREKKRMADSLEKKAKEAQAQAEEKAAGGAKKEEPKKEKETKAE